MKSGTRRARVADFIDRHATVLTLIAMAVLVLVPTKIAYDASGNATDAGNTATGAASRAHHAVVKLEGERRQRIYDQNGIDHYFCGKAVALEKILTLLVTAALKSHHPDELSPAQLRARAVFEEVLTELAEAPECEVLIPPPPKPKTGETRSEGKQAEERASETPAETLKGLTSPTTEIPGSSAPTKEGSTGGHTKSQPPQKSPPSGGKQSKEESSSGAGATESQPEAAAPTGSSEGVASSPPATETESTAPTTPTETTTPESTSKPLVPAVVESVEGVTQCLGKLDLGCTLHEVTGP